MRHRRYLLLREGLVVVLRAEQKVTSITDELCVRRNNVSKKTYRGRSFRDQEAVRERESEREGG